jgi:pimeloyl-ACP methyl ester carboxylesterase
MRRRCSTLSGGSMQRVGLTKYRSPIGPSEQISDISKDWSITGAATTTGANREKRLNRFRQFDLDAHFSRDVLLTNIMLYWITGAIGSSFWPYYARFHEPWIVPPGHKVMVPTGYAEFPREILTPPRSLAELTYGNITRWTPMPSGGHFAALEAPQQLAAEIRAFFRPLRSQLT